MSHSTSASAGPDWTVSRGHSPPTLAAPQPRFGLRVASHSSSGLAQAQSSCHPPASTLSQYCPRHPGRGHACAGHSTHFDPEGTTCLGSWVWEPQPESPVPTLWELTSKPVLRTSCQSGQLEKSPAPCHTSCVTRASSGIGSWELAGDTGPSPYPAEGLVLEASFPNPRTIFLGHPKQAKTRGNFTETFLWGVVKSIPTPRSVQPAPSHTLF